MRMVDLIAKKRDGQSYQKKRLNGLSLAIQTVKFQIIK